MYRNSFPRWLVTILLLALTILLMGGIWLYRVQVQQLRNRAEDELRAVAQLKADEIAAWRAERLSDAAVLSENTSFRDSVIRWLENPQAENTEELLTLFRTLQNHYHYYDVVLVDAEGIERLSLSGNLVPLHAESAQTVMAAWDEHRAMLTDLYLGTGDLPPRLDAIAPLFANNEPIGAVLLRYDASQFLFPLIQTWPTPSSSAETLLVRRDGDSVLYLNELRHRTGTALTLSFPMTQTDLPAAKAVLGVEGIVQGRDYRGVDVLAAVQAVPDSSWFIVSKVDKAEVFADLQLYARLIVGLILGALAAVITATAMVWERNQRRYYQALLRTEKAHQESEARYRTTLLSIGDGVVVTDTQERVVLLNPVAEALTGWSQSDACGKRIDEIFPIVNEETRQTVENPVHRVMREGIVVGLANHTLLMAKDGRQIPIADSAAPIHDGEGSSTGVVLVFRDQTEDRVVQEALFAEKERFRLAAESLSDVVYEWDIGDRVQWFGGVDQLLGYSPGEFPRTLTAWINLLHPKDRDRVWRAVEAHLDGAAAYDVEYRILQRGGNWRYWHARGTAVRDTSGKLSHFIGAITDITERKLAEQKLRDNQQKLEMLFEILPVGVSILDRERKLVLQNPALERILDISREGLLRGDYQNRRYLKPDGTPMPPEEFASTRVLNGESAVRNVEVGVVKENGSTVWTSVSAVTSPFEEWEVVIVTTDITEHKRVEEALRQRESTLDALINAPMETVALLDHQGTILNINENGALRLGYTPDTLIGHNIYSILPPEAAVVRKPIIDGVLQTGDPIHFEDSRSGRYFANSVYPVFDRQSKAMIGTAIYASDITERKQAEEAVRRYAERLAAINRLDRVISSNLEIDKIYDTFVTELRALVPLDRTSVILLNETGDQWQVTWQWTQHQPAINLGEWRPVTGSAIGWLVTNRVPFLENEIGERGTWVETDILQQEGIRTRLLLPLVVQGQIIGALTVARREPSPFVEEEQHILVAIADQLAIAIQNSRLYEQAQRYAADLEQRVIERTAELSDLYNNAPCGYHSLDTNGMFERINETELAWLGYTRAEIIGKKRFSDLLTLASVPTFKENFPGFKKRGWVKDLEFDMVRKDGSVLPVLLSATAIYDHEGHYLMSRSSIIDHTERKQAEESLRQRTAQLTAANQELEAFTYSVSHDLRAPLRAMDGFSAALLLQYHSQLDEQGQHYLDRIQEASRRMGQLIEDLLNLSRITRREMNHKEVDLSVLAREIAAELHTSDPQRQVEFVIADEMIVQGDASLLRIALGNLMNNAWKFTAHHPQAHIEVSMTQSQADGNVFFVRDNGVGFDMTYANKLFAPFQRLHGMKEFPGTGIGLVTVQRIITRHGGRIWTEAAVDQGAVFYFTLGGAV